MVWNNVHIVERVFEQCQSSPTPSTHASSHCVTECGRGRHHSCGRAVHRQPRRSRGPACHLGPAARRRVPGPPASLSTHAHRHPRARLRGHHRGSATHLAVVHNAAGGVVGTAPLTLLPGLRRGGTLRLNIEPCGSPRRPAHRSGASSSGGPTAGTPAGRDDGPAHQRQVEDRGPPVLRSASVCQCPTRAPRRL